MISGGNGQIDNGTSRLMQTQVDISALPVAREAALGLADVPIYLPAAAEAAAAAFMLYKAKHITQRIAEKKPYLMRELAASTECVPKTRDRFLHTRTISPFGKEIRHTRLVKVGRQPLGPVYIYKSALGSAHELDSHAFRRKTAVPPVQLFCQLILRVK